MNVRGGAILAVVMLVVSASPGLAQDGVSGGIKVGVNFADLDFAGDGEGDEDDSQKRRIGFVGGGFVDVPVSELFSFQPEILYTQKGTRFEGEVDFGGGAVSFEDRIEIDQIQIPLLAKATFPGMQVRPFVVFGPAVGFTTRAKVTSVLGDEEEDDDIKDDVETVEVSLVVGGGVRFGAGSVEVRYDHGLTNLAKTDDEDDGSELNSRTFSVLFGWAF